MSSSFAAVARVQASTTPLAGQHLHQALQHALAVADDALRLPICSTISSVRMAGHGSGQVPGLEERAPVDVLRPDQVEVLNTRRPTKRGTER